MNLKIVLLTQEGCNPCFRVKRLLRDLQVEHLDLVVREVPFSSPEGLELATANSILFPPAVLIGDMLLAKGRIHPEQLREVLFGSRALAPS